MNITRIRVDEQFGEVKFEFRIERYGNGVFGILLDIGPGWGIDLTIGVVLVEVYFAVYRKGKYGGKS